MLQTLDEHKCLTLWLFWRPAKTAIKAAFVFEDVAKLELTNALRNMYNVMRSVLPNYL